MEPEDFKKWSYGFKLPPGSWTWGPLDPLDGISEDEIEELRAAALDILSAMAVGLELDLLDEIDQHVESTEPVEARKMLEELFKKQA